MVVVEDLKARYISYECAEELKAQLQEHKKEKTVLIDTLARLKGQRSTGILAEDIGWQKEQERLRYVQDQIDIISGCLSRAEIMQTPATNDKVQLGSTVSIGAKDTKFKYRIVESIEADPEKGKISFKSPLGQELIGKTLNDTIEVLASKRKSTSRWKILSIA